MLNEGLKLIRDASIGDLLSREFLETKLLLALGLCHEHPEEQSQSLHHRLGAGCKWQIWQYPNQFAPYLLWLAENAKSINSYIEIGCRHGGTFVLTCEYIKRFNPNFNNAVAIDLETKAPLLVEYNKIFPFEYYQGDSHSDEFQQWLNTKKFDLCLIDGDHTYSGVKKDYKLLHDKGSIFVFHDVDSVIFDHNNPGTTVYWKHFKEKYSDQGDIVEFIEQYTDTPNEGPFLGIGVFKKK